jgi:hypothetical protein
MIGLTPRYSFINSDRFPTDFVFQLTAQEWNALRSQTVTSKKSSAHVMWSGLRGCLLDPLPF